MPRRITPAPPAEFSASPANLKAPRNEFTANHDIVTPVVQAASLPVWTEPYGVDVNPTTNRVYVSGYSSSSVVVIDGSTNAIIATVPVGANPMGLAVNSVTNRIYVPNGGGASNTVSVIDGVTDTVIDTVIVGYAPRYVAINEATNTIYVTNFGGTSFSIIDGVTHGVTDVPTPLSPTGIAVNPVTNRLYVAYGTFGASQGFVRMYDATTMAVLATTSVGQTPFSVVVNADTNSVYVSNFYSASVSVLDGATNALTATIATNAGPTDLNLDPTTNRVYLAEYNTSTLAVIDGSTNTVVARLPGGGLPADVGVNPLTGRVYIASRWTSELKVYQAGLSFTGSSAVSGATYTVAGSGTGMVSTSDEFQFLHKQMTGDARLTIRTASIMNTAAGATAGVMMRDGLGADARFVMTGNTGAGGDSVRQQYRSTVAATPTTATVNGAPVPEYLRITRVGNVFTTEYSADGTTWVAAGTPQTIAMGATIHVGIAVTSETAAALNTSTLDHVFTGMNVAPVAVADPSYTVNENGTLTQAAAGGVLTNDTDDDSDPLTAILVSGTAGLTLASDGSFTYVPPADFHGIATFTYKASDGLMESVAVTATITVTSVNDVPGFTKGADQTVSEDAAAQSVGSWATAISPGPADEAGQVVDFIVTNTNNPLFSVQPTVSATGTLAYTPAVHANGLATVSVRIHDDGGVANGGVDTSAIQTFTITVTAVNDAPVVTATVANLAYTENGTTILDAGITATDVDSANLTSATVDMTSGYQSTQDTLAFVTQNGITATWTAATGVLALTGSATLANYQAALRSITYTNSGNAPNTGARTVTFVVSDGALASNIASRIITITAVNDGPVNTVPGAQTTVTDLAEIFSGGIGNAISIADADVGGSSIQVQLTGTNGTVTLAGLTGLTFSVGDGTGDATMTFTGTLTNVNTALSGSRLTPTAGFNGTATLQIVTNDQGNSPSGALTDTDSVSITVEPIDLGIFTAHQDIGAPFIAGTANRSGTVYTVEGGGILTGGGTSDQFQFIHIPMTGDGRLTARVTAVENTNILAKAGVIFRDTLAANSASVYMELRPAAGSASVFVYRLTTGPRF